MRPRALLAALAIVLAVSLAVPAAHAQHPTARPAPAACTSSHVGKPLPVTVCVLTDAGHPDKIIAPNGRLLMSGVNRLERIIDPNPGPTRPVSTMGPTTADSTATATLNVTGWRPLAKVTDYATWNGSTDGYDYRWVEANSVGQQQIDGHWRWNGPYQFRQNPACYRAYKNEFEPRTWNGTNCFMSFYESFLGSTTCTADIAHQCFLDNYWGQRQFEADDTISVLFAGTWHDYWGTPYYVGDSIISLTNSAFVVFKVPNHLTRNYCTASFFYQLAGWDKTGAVGDDECAGLTAL